MKTRLFIIFTLSMMLVYAQYNATPRCLNTMPYNPVFAMHLANQTLLYGSEEDEKKKVAEVLDAWHRAAAQADFETYFGHMANDGVFLGTDAKENWQNQAFRDFSKPYFDRGKAWSFTAVERNIYLADNGSFAWFDELLDTQMGICRGSGVVKKIDDKWLIAHYVLSIAVPNENVAALLQLKKQNDSILILDLKRKVKGAKD